MLRSEHQLRLTEAKELGLNSSFSVPSSSLHSGQIRTLRGGQSSAPSFSAGGVDSTGTSGGGSGAPAWIQNVIRGKGKTTTTGGGGGASTPTASRQNSLLADTLGLRIVTSNKGDSNNSNGNNSPGPSTTANGQPDTPNSTGSATSTARALFSRLLGSQS